MARVRIAAAEEVLGLREALAGLLEAVDRQAEPGGGDALGRAVRRAEASLAAHPALADSPPARLACKSFHGESLRVRHEVGQFSEGMQGDILTVETSRNEGWLDAYVWYWDRPTA